MESVESQISTRTSDTLASLIKRLPAVWRTAREGRKTVAALPEYRGAVTVPESELIYSWIEGLCGTPHRRPGTAEGYRAEQWVCDRLREFGLEQVTMDPIPLTVWTAEKWSLTVPGETVPSFFVVNTGFTGAEGVTAPLVFVGTGAAKDFERVNVSGKIVVADVSFPLLPTGILMKAMKARYFLSDPDGWVTLGSRQYLNFARQNFMGGDTAETAPEDDVYWQAFRRGAKGICLILRDQPSNSNTHYGPYDGIMKPLPGLWIGKRDGVRLRELAKQGTEATLVLEGRTTPGVTHNVWGVLPGQSTDVILVTSHHDSPFQGAVEDGSGVALVLAQAWAWSRAPREQRPKTMVFVLDAGHFYGSIGADTFASAHQDILARARILITLEHLAAKEVEARGDAYAPTGRLAFTVMFTSPEPTTVASVIKALRTKPVKVTASIPADFFGPGPISDALGYVLAAGMPVVSWIGCPYYLLDQGDTLDKVEKAALKPICETVTEIVKTHMAMP
jgi:hypothetical protein